MTHTRPWALTAAMVMVALALGVILGSGPLRTALLGQHAQQVQELEGERDDALATAQQSQEQSQAVTEFVAEVTPALVNGALAGESVALVVIGETPADTVGHYQELVTNAGGDVAAVLELTVEWFDPSQAAFRAALAAQIATQVDQDVTAEDPGRTLAGALTALLRPDDGDGVIFGDPDSLEVDTPDVVAGILRDAGLLLGDTPTQSVGSVVILVGSFAMDDPAHATTVDEAALLASELRADGAAVLVSGIDNRNSMADAVRDSTQLSPDVSTLTAGDSPVGRALVALVLRHQLDGGQGHFGWGDDRELVP